MDTIYRWNRASGELTPLMARTPAFDSPEVPVVLFVTGESSDYLFLGVEERKEYEPGKSRKYDFQQLYYDKSDGQFYDGPIVNGDYVDEMTVDIYGIMSSSVAYPPGMFVNVIQAWTLVDLHGKGKLRGPLADLAATLKEDDNPVLMIATFK